MEIEILDDYESFLDRKKIEDVPTGIQKIGNINNMLFDFQKDIVKWALKRGRAAIFADCGMGKTPIQLEWAKHVVKHTNGSVLILAPLAVSEQTIREGNKFCIHVEKLESDPLGNPGIYITNYEQYHKYEPCKWSGIVLDESSILKSYTGKYRNEIIENSKYIPFRLACTATPAPNDFMELGNHSDFVGSMSRTEMLSMFFVHDGGETQKWRLKGHAETEFWKWVASWAVMIRKPSDLGYEDGNFILPVLNIDQVTVHSETPSDGFLFPMEAQTLQERQKARKTTTAERVTRCAEIVNNSDEIWLIWCNLNNESAELKKAIPGSVEVKGSDSDKHKKESLLAFANGEIRVLISKPKIAGMGMNFQVCHNMAFVGLSDSYEQYYQAVRRCWRFGQNHSVECKIITSDLEGAVVKNIERKEKDASRMAEEMVKYMHEINERNIKGMSVEKDDYQENKKHGDGWTVYKGDTVEVHRKHIKDNSIDYSVFSPPFSSLYTYSNSDRDMGNSKTRSEFYEHYKYLIKEQFRTLKPGRLLSFHCMNLPTSKTNDGYIGIVDFRGELIKMYEDEGFIYHSEVVIWKDPVIAMQRTKALGLLHKQIVKDSSMSRQGIPDYLVTMRKPGENAEPISGEFDEYVGEDSEEVGKGRFSIDVWQRYASPIWTDINPSNTLQHRSARDEKDERHICPLQLDVIHRALQLWSNPGDVVLSPFGGIGSEGYEAIKMGRKSISIELKESYFNQNVKNHAMAVRETKEGTLFEV
jgi:hypothetical protein